MTIVEMLQADGLSAEEIQVLTGNPKYAASLEKLRAKADEGETALLKATQLKEDIEKFNTETVIPYGLKKDQETAEAKGELAKAQAVLKSLKEAGYDIPDGYLAASTPTNTTTTDVPKAGAYVAPADLENQGKAYMQLLSVSERARDLLGHGLDIEAEYEDFQKNRRPGEVLRTFLDRKHDLPGKAAAKEAAAKAADQKKIEDAAIEKYKAEHPTSANPETATPRPTKFDRLANLDSERKQLWQTAQGREKATQDRIAKYATVQ